MGIPSFFYWLVDRYPLTVVDAIEESQVAVVNGVSVPVDSSLPNPNGVEFDNLYLDMNGVIHPCFHPEGLPAPKTYDEVFKAIYKYIDQIFSIVRPRKLLFLAIDGVAPRAKMNQQRARRFRAAKDAAVEAFGTKNPMGVYELRGEELTLLEQTKMLDSNVITPGTEFMAILSSALRYYVHMRMNVDPGWRGIKVILSDASVPGEGEHKIMSYIRLQRNLPGFNPNTRHCLYGLDADLIMLALATHEIHFSILREAVCNAHTIDRTPRHGKYSLPMNRKGVRRESGQGAVHGMNVEDSILRKKFQFVNIWVLRDYLMHDLRIPAMKQDLERLIDDFVFMCLFVGNDFLPHVPSLEISEGAINLLMNVYKEQFIQIGGYLTNSFEVNLERLERFVQALGSHESTIFRKRSQEQKEREIRFRRFSANCSFKRTQSSIKPVHDNANSVVDKVKLGEEGWKQRFYTEKFEVKTDDDREKVQRHAVLKYVEGLCWVMHYYYKGVCSWQWFYPYHYAPFASDFDGLDQLEIRFTLGEPFKPFDQLMGVLPAARNLMIDKSSPISDFYPTDFEIDMNGKRKVWQGICKLPFISESRLLSEIAKVEHTLTDEERQRNSLGLDILFVHISHPLAVKIFCFSNRKSGHPKLPKAKVKRKINPEVSGGMNGYIYISDKPVCPVEIYSSVDDMEMITNNEVLTVFYKYPSFHTHIPKPPEGVIMPRKSISKQDVRPPPILWHEKSALFGRIYTERPIRKSVSGPVLGRLAHELVSKYYIAKRQESMGSMKIEDNIGEDDLASQSNLKPIDCVKEVNGDRENYIDGERGRITPRKRKWSGGHDGPDNEIKSAKQQECMEVVDCAGVDDFACQSNLKSTDYVGEIKGDGESYINGEPRKKKPRKKKRRKGQDGPENKIEAAKLPENMGFAVVLSCAGLDDLACHTNLKPADCVREVNGGGESYIDGGPDNEIKEAKQQECMEVVDRAGVVELACQSNLQSKDYVGEVKGAGESNIDGEPRKKKSRKKKRRKGQGGTENKIEEAKQPENMGFAEVLDSAGVDDLACHRNLKPRDCVREVNGGGESYIDGGPDNEVKEAKQQECIEVVDRTGVVELACQSNLQSIDYVGEVKGDGESNIDGEPRKKKSRKKKRRKGQGGTEIKIEAAKQPENMGFAEVLDSAGVDDLAFHRNLKPRDCVREVNGGGESYIDGGPDNEIKEAKQQECMEVVDRAGVVDLACQSNLQSIDYVGEVKGDGESNIDGEPMKMKSRKKGQGGTENKIEAAKQPENMGFAEVLDSAGVDDLACHRNLKPKDCVREVNGGGESFIDGEPKKSMGCMEVVDRACVDDLACQSNLQSTDYVGEVKGDGENNIDGEPRKKNRKRKRRTGQGRPENKIEASKQQENMGFAEVLDSAGVDDLACHTNLKPRDCVREVNGGGESYIDGEPKKGDIEQGNGAKVMIAQVTKSAAKQQESMGCVEVQCPGSDDLACQSNLKPTDCVLMTK